MFCSVAVGRLRQAYKSPAIIGLRCVFKTLWVRIGARVCMCICRGRHNGVRVCAAGSRGRPEGCRRDAEEQAPVPGTSASRRGLESTAILLLFPKSPVPLKLDPPRFALPQPRPGHVSSPARHSLLLNKISLGSF